jgi:hypothetical protein
MYNLKYRSIFKLNQKNKKLSCIAKETKCERFSRLQEI